MFDKYFGLLFLEVYQNVSIIISPQKKKNIKSIKRSAL